MLPLPFARQPAHFTLLALACLSGHSAFAEEPMQLDSLQVSGTARLDEVGEAFGVTLEHEDVDTVSGLVLALLDRPPVVGDEVACGVVRFSVTEIDGHGVGSCRACRIVPPTPSLDEER